MRVWPHAIAWARSRANCRWVRSTCSTRAPISSVPDSGTLHAGSGAGRSSSNASFCSRSRTDEKYSSSRARSVADTDDISLRRCSDTAESTLCRTITAGSGWNSARFGSRKPSPKMRAYSARGDVSDGFRPLDPRALQLALASPSQVTSSERNRVPRPMWSPTRVSMLVE